MSDTLNSTQIVISSDSLDASIETISGDSETIPVNNSDSGNSSRTDESLNSSACAGADVEMTEDVSTSNAAPEGAGSTDVGATLFETVTLLSTKQKSNFPSTVPSTCLVDPSLVRDIEILMFS